MKYLKLLLHECWMLCKCLGLTKCLDDETFVRLQYLAMMGKRISLANPIDFNEKIQWLKIHYRNPLMVMCSDKWAVREFVKERIGEKYLAKCLGIYNDVDEIPYESLPDKFVLKATHGSGWNIICPDKDNLDWSLAKKKMRKWMKTDFYNNGREWQYHSIRPRIICEEFLVDPNVDILRDYKLFTFRGITKYIWVYFTERKGDATNKDFKQCVGYSKPNITDGYNKYLNFYDTAWNFKPGCGSELPCKETNTIIKPKCFTEMIEVAYKLSHDFPQCRVDLYVLGGKRIVFGELTFTSGNGCNAFYPQTFNNELGAYINLDLIERKYLI